MEIGIVALILFDLVLSGVKMSDYDKRNRREF